MLKTDRFNSLVRRETPFYYYDLDLLRETLEEAARAAEPYGFHIHYALKANAEERILRAMSAAGFGADCVSGPEVQRAAECGFDPKGIMFAGVGKTDREIREALAVGIGCFNVESIPELENIANIAAEAGVKAPIAIRVNPNIDAHTHKYVTTGLEENKFGISEFELDLAIGIIKTSPSLDFRGIQFHIGSQIIDVEEVFATECERAAYFVDYFESRGLRVSSIDLGGGLGIDYHDPDSQPVPEFARWFKVIDEHLKRRPDQQVHFEPGRCLVAQCGSLITRIVYVKVGQTRRFAITDAGMNDLIRPALYGSYHKIENLSAAYLRGNEDPVLTYDVVGPVCESSDTWGTDRELPQTRRGDLLAIRSAGAYGATMASNYNLRPFAGVVYSDES